MAEKKIRKPRAKKTVETLVEVAANEPTAKEKFSAEIEEMKRKDPHQYSIREAELLKQLNNL